MERLEESTALTKRKVKRDHQLTHVSRVKRRKLQLDLGQADHGGDQGELRVEQHLTSQDQRAGRKAEHSQQRGQAQVPGEVEQQPQAHTEQESDFTVQSRNPNVRFNTVTMEPSLRDHFRTRAQGLRVKMPSMVDFSHIKIRVQVMMTNRFSTKHRTRHQVEWSQCWSPTSLRSPAAGGRFILRKHNQYVSQSVSIPPYKERKVRKLNRRQQVT